LVKRNASAFDPPVVPPVVASVVSPEVEVVPPALVD